MLEATDVLKVLLRSKWHIVNFVLVLTFILFKMKYYIKIATPIELAAATFFLLLLMNKLSEYSGSSESRPSKWCLT